MIHPRSSCNIRNIHRFVEIGPEFALVMRPEVKQFPPAQPHTRRTILIELVGFETLRSLIKSLK